MGKGKEVKEDERALIVGMAKGGATISKIVGETKRHCCNNLEKISTSPKRFPNCKTQWQTSKDNVKRPSFMIRGCMSYDGVGPLAIVNAIVNGSVTGAMQLPSHFAKTFLTTCCRKTTQGAKPLSCKMTMHHSIELAQ